MLEKDDSVLLVENLINARAKLTEYAAVSFSIVFIFVACVIFRRLFRLSAHEENAGIGKIFLHTLGALLLTKPNDRIRNRPERILHFFFIVFAMLLSMLASAILLGNILAKETQTGMNTLKELAESKLPVCISTELNQTRSEWSQGIE